MMTEAEGGVVVRSYRMATSWARCSLTPAHQETVSLGRLSSRLRPNGLSMDMRPSVGLASKLSTSM